MKEEKGERWGCDSSEGEQEEIWVPGGFADKIRLIIYTIDGSTFRFHNGFQPATIFTRLLPSSTRFLDGSCILGLQFTCRHATLSSPILTDLLQFQLISTTLSDWIGLAFSSSLLYRSSRSELARNGSIFVSLQPARTRLEEISDNGGFIQATTNEGDIYRFSPMCLHFSFNTFSQSSPL